MNKPLAPFLIRIFGQDDAIIGAGFLVSAHHALTCAHVIADALGLDRNTQDCPAAEISFDFPLLAPHQPLRAAVARWIPMCSADGQQPRGDEDIALLEILDELPRECRLAPLAPADADTGAAFQTFGFSKERGVPADGCTKGEPISGGCVVIEDTKTIGYFVEAGFSGAPVWSNTAVIGMIVRTDQAELRSAYMIPSSLLWKDVMKASFPAETKLSVSLADELVELLEAVATENWPDLYWRCNRAPWNDAPANIWIAALQLLRLSDPQRGLDFVTALGNQFHQPALVEWVERAKRHLKLPVGAVSGPVHSATTLLFHVEPLPALADSFQLHAWLWQGEQVERLTDLEPAARKWYEVVGDLQLWVTRTRSHYADLRVEITLPRSQFGCEITQWEMNPRETLLHQVPVALRCQKRFIARQKQLAAEKNGLSLTQRLQLQTGTKPVRLADWRHKSSQLRSSAQTAAGHLLFALAPGHWPDHLDEEFRGAERGIFVACGFDPESANEDSAFSIALDYGAPLAVWFRELPNAATLDEGRLKDTLGLTAEVTLGALPRHIWGLQQQALTQADRDNLLYHLTLLYDDYERVPPCA